MFVRRTVRVMVLGLIMAATAGTPAMAGEALGSLASSQNATIDNMAALPNTAIFSGDTLSVRDGVAVVSLARGSRMVFGHETQASFMTEGKDVTVRLVDGNVLLYHAASDQSMRLKAADVTVSPVAGFKTLGEVAMLNGWLVVTAKQGTLQVEGAGRKAQVTEGKTLTLPTKTAQSPGSTAGSGAKSGVSKVEWAGLVASATGAVLAGVAISRSNAAYHAASAANSEAALAASNASAATSAANAAISAATAAQQTANSLGCALDRLGAGLGLPSSPYTPTNGNSCP